MKKTIRKKYVERVLMPFYFIRLGVVSILFPRVGKTVLFTTYAADEKLYQAFKAGCLSANDGIFPDAFEEDIKVLFEEWRNKKAP